jgi:hypothetical protein
LIILSHKTKNKECVCSTEDAYGTVTDTHPNSSVLKQRLRLEVLQVVMSAIIKIAVFWDMTPCSLVGRYEHFGGTCCLHLYPDGEGGDLFEMFVPVYLTTQYHIPEDYNLKLRWVMKFCISIFCCINVYFSNLCT